MNIYFPKTVGGNAKTGLLTSTSSMDTCPDTCPLKGKGCYARFGNLARVWKNVSEGNYSIPFSEFLARIKSLPPKSLWRHNQAGDLPGINLEIDNSILSQIVKANKGKRGFTYTHKPLTETNLEYIRSAIAEGFTINISKETLSQADSVMAMGLPVAVILPKDTPLDGPKTLKTPNGNSVLICPQQRNPNTTTCASCGLCANGNRKYAIGFVAHGNARNMATSTTKE